ncbi:LAGLIDADG family homing endonuclease [Marinimicrobium alkaliphilum]|uniref:LAGLIDADG family homing endonuclease n=1 Tax=Marinimicrobium alkaliphilum TaxID=2202654 RepID=UPI000DB975EE|nr:LAGLIDADG family homing endonuclease [Marinimicrobium alkaliphilum]
MTSEEKPRTAVEQPLLDLQPTSQEIWDSKYRLKDDKGEPVDRDVHATWARVAKALSDIEPKRKAHWHKEFLWALENGAIPAGRIVSNAGAQDYKPATSTINCTVSGTVEDSMLDILEKNTEAGLTLKAGCGIGYEFSTLRPKGAYVAGAGATTSGPLSFMDIFDKMCFTISSAGGRRGAQMATFDIHHPDVAEFIRAKREDGRLRQFNLSLLITDEFIQAVKADATWGLSFPLTERDQAREQLDLADVDQVTWRRLDHLGPHYLRNAEGEVACKIYKRLPARQLWNQIMRSTYDYAEPGFILIDRVNEWNNNWYCETIRATNPCVTADTWVHTSDGPRQVHQLLGSPFRARVDGVDHASGPEGFFQTGVKSVKCLLTEDGHQLQLTEDHRVRKVTARTRWRLETEWTPARELQPGDEVLLNNHRGNSAWPGDYSYEQGYLLGALVGDGTLKQDAAILSVWPQAQQVNGRAGLDSSVMNEISRCVATLPQRADFAGWMPVAGRGEYRLKLAALRHLALDVGMRPRQKVITPVIEAASSDCYRGFLRGFFDADGSVQGTQVKGVSVRLAQSDVERLATVQRMLLRLGINSRLYRERRPAGPQRLPDGKGGQADYAIKAQHELVIAGDNLAVFAREVGFADREKQARLEQSLTEYRRALNKERFVARVCQLIDVGDLPVFDVQVPGVNTFDANGLHAHNCGEQPLPPYGSCLLGSVNLTGFVAQAFTEHATFDWEKFRRLVRVFTRMLDNVVEINGLALPRQREEITRKRRHGMGFLGLGSALTMLRIPYGSPASVAFTEQVSKELALAGWEEGVALAKEKGGAPIMEERFEITPALIAQRPELGRAYKVGDQVPGKVLMARYGRYMQQLADEAPELVAAIAEHGSRFTHHSSIAPTGTISLSLANNASNGIEPSFAHHYARNVIRAGRKSKEKVDVFSYELLRYRQLIDANAKPYPQAGETGLPDYFVVSDQINPEQHVDVQAAAQKWVDSSISKTINVPTDIPYESFKDIYLYAYEKGLKGCTTFRYNPEAFQGVLVKEQDLENTVYVFELEDGAKVELKGNEPVVYDGETHTAANLYDALKEGYYGKF